MTELPVTDEQLLNRLSDSADREAWETFVAIYQPLIYRIARQAGLQDADAHNHAQDVLQKLSRNIAAWKPGQPAGSFRRWLKRIARNAAIDLIRKLKPDAAIGGSSVQSILQNVASRDDEANFEAHWHRAAFRWAAAKIRSEFAPDTWEAFWLSTVEGLPIDVVAKQLRRSIGSVYTARSRIVQRLKKEISTYDWENES
jgi:RNA polymerase sigma factor (sigma-70 family)